MLLTHGLLWCRWTTVTTSKLLPDYNLAVLTSFVQEEKRKKKKSQLKVLVLKLQCATFHLGAQKWILSSCLNTCRSPWWAVCPETAPHRRLRSLTSPQLPQASEKQMPKWERGAGRRERKAMLMFSVFLKRLWLMQDTLFCRRHGCSCGSSWQGLPSTLIQ